MSFSAGGSASIPIVTFAENKGPNALIWRIGRDRWDFSAETRMSGVDLTDGRIIRKGAVDGPKPLL
jgi:high-affinity K+ transport system ATPase subunit B